MFDDGKKSDVTPIRFVCACEKGHLQDIDWKWVVHRIRLPEPMWVEERARAPIRRTPTSYAAAAGGFPCRNYSSRAASVIAAASGPGCSIGSDGCDQKLKLLTRTATNTYFPQVYTVISLPAAEDELTRLVESLSGDLANVQSAQDVAPAKRFNTKEPPPSAPIPTTKFSRGLPAFVRARSRMRTVAKALRI